MNVTVIQPPPFQPITLQDVYSSLRLDTEGSPPTHPDDVMLLGLIEAARADIEKRVRRSLVRKTLRASYAGFPDTRLSGTNPAQAALTLHRPPLVSVDSVQYYDPENTLRTIDRADYYVTDEDPPRLRFVSSFSAPTVYDRPDAVRVTYTVGYATTGSPPTTQADYAANVPEPLKQACLLSVQALYDDLQPADWDRLQRAIEALVQPLRVQLAL
jgi:uncharacterized phiE125 gp8 family phage protein